MSATLGRMSHNTDWSLDKSMIEIKFSFVVPRLSDSRR